MHQAIPEFYPKNAIDSRLTSALRSPKIYQRIKALAIKLLLLLSRSPLQVSNSFCLTEDAVFLANISKLIDSIE